MTTRAAIFEMLAGLLGFGRVYATKQATSTKQVLASIEGNTGEAAGDAERRAFQALWGHAAIVFMPPADTEVMFVRIGEEMVPFASREVRWGFTVIEGEVVVRALHADGARLRLKPDGKLVHEGGTASFTNAAGAAATKALAMAEETKARLDTIQAAFDAHTHILTISAAAGSGGTGTAAVPAAPIGSLGPIASTRVFTKD